MKAVLLAAGMGSRLLPLTAEIPKPLVKVGGRPLLLRTIDRLAGPLRVGTSDFRQITNNRGIETDPSWSPTGREIAFTSDRSGSPRSTGFRWGTRSTSRPFRSASPARSTPTQERSGSTSRLYASRLLAVVVVDEEAAHDSEHPSSQRWAGWAGWL